MEIQDANFSMRDLEMRTYRYLQQLAKSLCLPSNVKKVYLIQLIHAKKFKSENEVNSIIQQVKSERQQLVQSRKKNRKRHLQNQEISSTCKLSQSPSISNTPKRSVYPVLRYSPDFTYSTNKSTARQNYRPSSNISSRSITRSDRVLRSFNLKALRKSYGTVNLNTTNTNAVRVQNQGTSPKEKFVRIVSTDGRLTKFNLNCTERRSRPNILGGNSCLVARNDNPRQYIVPHNPRPPVTSGQDASHLQPKRSRTLSGIYPLVPQDKTYQSYDQIRAMKLRRTDGKLSTINALVQRRPAIDHKPPPRPNNDVTIQDILSSINISLNSLTHTTPLTYQNPAHSSLITSYPSISKCKENEETDAYSMYYHKKIRSEQMGYRRQSYREPEEKLPSIADVFSRFNCVPNRTVMQPLYVQVSEESGRIPSNAPYSVRNVSSTLMLESIYNFRASLLTNTPLLQIATTCNTKCVYSTPIIATAMVQQSCPPTVPETYTMPHISTAVSPVSQATIPEMVEDALEIISQDGDYMERISIDIRVQCVLCSWAGPKIILEFHIRKEHPTKIHSQPVAERSVVYTLGALNERRLWLSEVLEHDGALCVLSAQYREPDCVVATLCALSSDTTDKFGTITTYNKVTGEPHTWEGPIRPLPPNLPYENNLPGLTVQLSKLDLLPNSANLTLLNKEFVLNSSTKVIVGQPELNDIQIILFVRIS